MNRKRYVLTSRISTGTALFSFIGLLWTIIAGSRNKGSSKERGNTYNPNNPDNNGGPIDYPVDPNFNGPPGPYVTPESANEMVTLPWPPTPDNLNAPRTICPWDDTTNLVVWNDNDISTDGANVTLPAGTRVLLSASPARHMGLLTIPADSELIISDDTSHIDLHVTGIHVLGTLTVGTVTCPIRDNTLTITLHGQRPPATQSLPLHYKGIYVAPDTGNLQLHGQRYFPTWTRLAQTAPHSANWTTTLLVQHPVNWRVGQQIVVTTSSLKDSRDEHQNEVHTIRAVYNNPTRNVGAQIIIEQPLQFTHVANSNYQVEVGLLSRNIVIQGAADDSPPTDPDPLDCTLGTKRLNYDADMGTQCPDTSTNGFGGHVLVHGTATVQGVEFYRMGQTNVESRYPIHFQGLGDGCPTCLVKDSSFHQSYYRCAVLSGTNNTLVMENVGYDVIGYCFMLGTGTEERNTMSYNLAAHIHWLGPEAAHNEGRDKSTYYEDKDTLAFPADVSASGFLITNLHNHFIGNAASGGWSGFHVINLDNPIGPYRDLQWSPSSRPTLTFDGNSAHSSAFWWYSSGTIFIGGSMAYQTNGELFYTPRKEGGRDPCSLRKKVGECKADEFVWNRMTNTKTFLASVYGLFSWKGRMELDGFEAHDVGTLMEFFENGFWMNRILLVCRSGEALALPDGFNTGKWSSFGLLLPFYGQKWILSNSIFRNCGFRSDEYDQYDNSPTRGCVNDGSSTGCSDESSVFHYYSYKDDMLPEIAMATKNITYENCGRRFAETAGGYETNQAMRENILDTDGTLSGLNEYTFVAPAIRRSKGWWDADDEVVLDVQRPHYFIKKSGGPRRALAYVKMRYDDSLHDNVGYGSNICYQKAENCPVRGFVRHLGKRFTPDPIDNSTWGLPMTNVGKIVGLTGGYGWLLSLEKPPKTIVFERLEIDPDSVLMLSIKYPKGSTFKITANAKLCNGRKTWKCIETYEQTDDIEEVRRFGNKYYVHPNGVLTFRPTMIASQFVGFDTDGDGVGEWAIPGWDTPDRNDLALDRFERDGVRLPMYSLFSNITLEVACIGGGLYCSGDVEEHDPDVCPQGYTQVAFDRCCRNGSSDCVYAWDD